MGGCRKWPFEAALRLWDLAVGGAKSCLLLFPGAAGAVPARRAAYGAASGVGVGGAGAGAGVPREVPAGPLGQCRRCVGANSADDGEGLGVRPGGASEGNLIDPLAKQQPTNRSGLG